VQCFRRSPLGRETASCFCAVITYAYSAPRS